MAMTRSRALATLSDRGSSDGIAVERLWGLTLPAAVPDSEGSRDSPELVALMGTLSGGSPHHRLLTLRTGWRLGNRKPADQCLAVDQLDGQTIGKLPCRRSKRAGRHEDAASRANLMHRPGELTHFRHADFVKEPVLALNQDRILLLEQDEIVAAIRASSRRLLYVKPLAPVNLGDKVLEGTPAKPFHSLEHRELRGRQDDQFVGSRRLPWHSLEIQLTKRTEFARTPARRSGRWRARHRGGVARHGP